MQVEERLRADIVEVGRRVYARGFVASNDGNISVRLDDKRVLTTPTGVSKGFMTPDMMVVTDLAGDKIAAQLTEWIDKQWKLTPVFVQGEKRRFGVTNAYEQPETLGVDRWLAIVAGRQHPRFGSCNG